ncbi:BMP family ABC transporter substrate-binding protein [[Eubacterium] cellulosolvens]
MSSAKGYGTSFLIAALIIGLVVGAVAGYLLKPIEVPAGATVTKTTTQTVAQTATQTITQVVTQTVGVEKKLKAAWIYVGPIGDYGWSHAHNVGRLRVAAEFPWLDAEHYAESVPEADVERYVDRFIVDEKCDVVFTTSFGFMDGTLAAASKYPDKILFHCSGYERAPNMGTYFAEFYQLYYLCGLMAGALTETGKTGYVAAYLTPEVIRHINAFALGVTEVNPEATVDVRVISAWYDPTKARLAAEDLVAAGCDALAFTEDSPTVIEVGQSYCEKYASGAYPHPVYTFSHYSPMQRFGVDSCVSGELVDWGILYEDILMKIHLGVYNNTNLGNVDYWWMLHEKAAQLGGEFGVPINPKFIPALKAKMVKDRMTGESISVYDLVMRRLAQMSEETVLFDPFTGPIYDTNGKLRIAAGVRGSHDDLWTMDWFVAGVSAPA